MNDFRVHFACGPEAFARIRTVLMRAPELPLSRLDTLPVKARRTPISLLVAESMTLCIASGCEDGRQLGTSSVNMLGYVAKVMRCMRTVPNLGSVNRLM